MVAEIAGELFLMCWLKDGGRRESLVSCCWLADLAAAGRRQESNRWWLSCSGCAG